MRRGALSLVLSVAISLVSTARPATEVAAAFAEHQGALSSRIHQLLTSVVRGPVAEGVPAPVRSRPVAEEILAPVRSRSKAIICPARYEWPIKARSVAKATSGGIAFPSQCGQDAYLASTFFGGATDGVYLDIGCNDGKSNSNTWHFNRKGWRGVCIEGDPNTFKRISRTSGRSDGRHFAVSSSDGEASFSRVGAPDGGLSGLQSTLDHARARSFGEKQLTVPTMTPTRLLSTYYNHSSMRVIDYVSLDVEGHELEVVRAWPFESDAWCVGVFTIENNLWCDGKTMLPELKRLLEPHGYRHKRAIGPDELFVRTRPCAGGLRAGAAEPGRGPRQSAVRGRPEAGI